jgi:hypothetical protein
MSLHYLKRDIKVYISTCHIIKIIYVSVKLFGLKRDIKVYISTCHIIKIIYVSVKLFGYYQ